METKELTQKEIEMIVDEGTISKEDEMKLIMGLNINTSKTGSQWE